MSRLYIKPFEVPSALDSLTETYPPVESVINVAKTDDKDTRCALARLWLSEGIPYCFKSKPGVYESLRVWLSRQLQVQAKEITIIGSGRQGFCLSPGKIVGKSFDKRSDLDLTIISAPLFKKIERTFKRWHTDYLAGTVSPRNKRESKLWKANAESVRTGLARGFIDPHKIPTLNRYPAVQAIMDAMYVAREKLKVTPGAPRVTKVSVRVYKDWDSFILQMVTNLERLARDDVGR